MPSKKRSHNVIAVCIQEPTEDGSQMDLGAIKGDNLRFLHQAFITDTVMNALRVPDTDVRLYYIDEPERARLVKIISEYLRQKCSAKVKVGERYKACAMERERWGVRTERIFKDCFKQGYGAVLLTGSRTPTMNAMMMGTALKVLKKSDAVFGPTPEGRYYTIGMKDACHINLSDFDWKSPSIYSEVSAAFSDQDLSWSELEIWYAVESPEELDLMARDINQYRFEDDDTSARETELVMERLITKLGT